MTPVNRPKDLRLFAALGVMAAVLLAAGAVAVWSWGDALQRETVQTEGVG